MSYDEIVIRNIENHIEKIGIKKQAVAKRVGMSKATFSHILHGRMILRVNTLFKIAEVLGVPPEELLKQ